ncbi:MAG: hypothetical protein L3J82_10465, partial [Planctomycetes bacterium]|nr:hypothetical protein [Planctomycetota bacterium]
MLIFYRLSTLAVSALLAMSMVYAEVAKPVADKASETAKVQIPDNVRKYLVENYFKDSEPSDDVISQSIEILKTPEAVIRHVRENEWEAGQLENFAPNKLAFILKTPSGETRTLVFRDGKKRKDELLTPVRARILRRMYDGTAFSSVEHAELSKARANKDLDLAGTLESAIKAASEHELDEETLKRARQNFSKAKNSGKELAIALSALAGVEYAKHSQWAAVWLISRMDKMSFRRE